MNVDELNAALTEVVKKALNEGLAKKRMNLSELIGCIEGHKLQAAQVGALLLAQMNQSPIVGASPPQPPPNGHRRML